MTVPANPTGPVVIPPFPAPTYMQPVPQPNQPPIGGGGLPTTGAYGTPGLTANPQYFLLGGTFDDEILGSANDAIGEVGEYYVYYEFGNPSYGQNRRKSFVGAACYAAYLTHTDPLFLPVRGVLEGNSGSSASWSSRYSPLLGLPGPSYDSNAYGHPLQLTVTPTDWLINAIQATRDSAVQVTAPYMISHWYGLWLGDQINHAGSSLSAPNIGAYVPYIQALVTNAVYGVYNTVAATIKSYYDIYRNQLNANPIAQNPGGYVLAIVGGAVTTVMGQITSAIALVTGVAQGLLTQINNIKTGTIDPLIPQAVGIINAQVKFATDTLTALQATILAQVGSLVATAQAALTGLQVEIERQKNAAEQTVNTTIANAMATIGTTATQILAIVASYQAQIAALATQVIGIAVQQVAALQAQLADRPLFYGALTSPITIVNATDVIVIPPGGLIITAD